MSTDWVHFVLTDFLLTELSRPALRDSKLPRYRQLYTALRHALQTGTLRAGERLPSSRELTDDLHMARNTVIAAINQLTVEGYLQARIGSGTYVADSVPPARARRAQKPPSPSSRLSRRGSTLAHSHLASELEVQPFTPGLADFSAFPVALWQRLQNKHWRMMYPDMLDYSSRGGFAPLRHAVADYLRLSRSVPVHADQVLITSGTQQSLELCAQLLADHQDTVWMEDPGYWGAVKAFLATGLRLHPVPVDQHGMAPHDHEPCPEPRLIYLTPSHQYPLGSVMPLARRHQLLALARRHQAWILEDDYDSEFRFSGPPLSSLAGLDVDQRVLYMGSFSKVLYPGLKLGYLVVPEGLVTPFRQAHYDLNRPGQVPLQAALAEFIEMGHFGAALRRARQSHAVRRQALLQALQPCLGRQITISGAEQGLHLCLRMADHVDDQALARVAATEQLSVRPLSAYCLQRRDARGLVLGYGYAPLAQIPSSGAQLARLLMRSLRSP